MTRQVTWSDKLTALDYITERLDEKIADAMRVDLAKSWLSAKDDCR